LLKRDNEGRAIPWAFERGVRLGLAQVRRFTTATLKQRPVNSRAAPDRGPLDQALATLCPPRGNRRFVLGGINIINLHISRLILYGLDSYGAESISASPEILSLVLFVWRRINIWYYMIFVPGGEWPPSGVQSSRTMAQQQFSRALRVQASPAESRR
jgi:hypothetical protein